MASEMRIKDRAVVGVVGAGLLGLSFALAPVGDAHAASVQAPTRCGGSMSYGEAQGGPRLSKGCSTKKNHKNSRSVARCTGLAAIGAAVGGLSGAAGAGGSCAFSKAFPE